MMVRVPVSKQSYLEFRRPDTDHVLLSLHFQPGGNLAIRTRILSMIQTWALGVKDKPGMSYIVETYYLLQAEKYEFPPVQSSSILLETSAVCDMVILRGYES